MSDVSSVTKLHPNYWTGRYAMFFYGWMSCAVARLVFEYVLAYAR